MGNFFFANPFRIRLGGKSLLHSFALADCPFDVCCQTNLEVDRSLVRSVELCVRVVSVVAYLGLKTFHLLRQIPLSSHDIHQGAQLSAGLIVELLVVLCQPRHMCLKRDSGLFRFELRVSVE